MAGLKIMLKLNKTRLRWQFKRFLGYEPETRQFNHIFVAGLIKEIYLNSNRFMLFGLL